MTLLPVLALITIGLLQVVAALSAVHATFGPIAALIALAVMLALKFRAGLPLVVASYFGARDVWGWHWALAIIFAAPGLLLLVPQYLVPVMLKRNPTGKRNDATNFIPRLKPEMLLPSSPEEDSRQDQPRNQDTRETLSALQNAGFEISQTGSRMVVRHPFRDITYFYSDAAQLESDKDFLTKIAGLESKDAA